MLRRLIENGGVYMAPEGDGAGAGGGGSTGTQDPPNPPAPPEPPKTYSQKEKDADEAKLRRRYDREIKELKKQLEQQNEAIESLKKKPDPVPPSTNPSGDPTTDGRLELLEKRFARTEEELNEKIKAADQRAEAEKRTRLNLQRDQLLDEALRDAGVMGKHMTQARRFFLPQVEWDDLEGDNGGWMFRTRNGNIVPIMDGVAEELPDNLKPSKMKHGGAGNTNGLPGQQQRKHRELEDAKKKLAELKEAHRRGGGKQSDMMAFTKQKKLVQALERELSTPNK